MTNKRKVFIVLGDFRDVSRGACYRIVSSCPNNSTTMCPGGGGGQISLTSAASGHATTSRNAKWLFEPAILTSKNKVIDEQLTEDYPGDSHSACFILEAPQKAADTKIT